MPPRVETIEVRTPTMAPGMCADLYHPAGEANGSVVLVHGFKGHRRWGFLPHLARELADNSLAALVLDLSHNGVSRDSPPERPYDQPERFEANTLSQEVIDVRGALAWWRGRNSDLARLPVGMFGHSRGGIAATISTLERDDISALAMWSAPAEADRFSDHQKHQWRERGRYDFTVTDGTRLALGAAYLRDLEANTTRYRLSERVAELHIPLLVVHGHLDLAIPPGDAETIVARATRTHAKKLLMLKTGHTFGYEPPAGASPSADARATADKRSSNPLAEACNETVEWFRTYLRGED